MPNRHVLAWDAQVESKLLKSANHLINNLFWLHHTKIYEETNAMNQEARSYWYKAERII